ncbi:MAG: UDP-glucose 4-epimerase, partial [Brachymonas sp.]
HPARLIGVPQTLLAMSLRFLGKSALAERLLGDLAVDSFPASELLGWKPPFTMQQGLLLTARHFLQHRTKP